MPDVRSDEDCRRLIVRLEKTIYRGCFTLIYAYGLRINEAVTLPVTAVDSKQMVLRLIGKRNKERAMPLTESILEVLRKVWKTHRSPRWIFPSRRIVTHLPNATARTAFNKARNECGFDEGFRPHSLRHSFATHMLAQGVELADIVRRFGPKYTSQFGHVMMASQKRALANIAACCTEELGGRLFRCKDCNESFWRFHCCRNRACPQCHGKQTQPEVHVRPLDACGGRGRQGTLCEEASPRRAARHPGGAAYLVRPVRLSPARSHVDHRRRVKLPLALRVPHDHQQRSHSGHGRDMCHLSLQGSWHHSKRDLSSRAWLLLMLQKPTDAAGPPKIADLLEALSQLAASDDVQDIGNGDSNVDSPCCPNCGSTPSNMNAAILRTTFSTKLGRGL